MQILRSPWLLLLGLGAIALVFFLWLGGYFLTEKRNRYLIPRDYAGWLCVNYGVTSAPQLPVDENGFAVVKFPTSGIVQTSSLGKSGPLVDSYFIYDDKGEVPMAPTHIGGGGTYSDSALPAGHFASYFWVSTDPKEDYLRTGRPSSETLRGKCF